MFDSQLFDAKWCADCGCIEIVRNSPERGKMKVLQTPTYQRNSAVRRFWKALREG